MFKSFPVKPIHPCCSLYRSVKASRHTPQPYASSVCSPQHSTAARVVHDAQIMPFSAKVVFVYADRGTSEASVDGWVHTLVTDLHLKRVQVHTTTASTVIADLGRTRASDAILIMPGGADLPYLSLLTATHLRRIREWVQAGASYIGTCAGAYFASSHCIFESDDANLRVVGSRPLRLFPHPAVGAVRPGFRYDGEEGATREMLTCWRGGGAPFRAAVYCNGGAAWAHVADGDDGGRTRVLARYSEAVLERHGVGGDERPAAVVAHAFGRGCVVLCGVHPEMAGEWSPLRGAGAGAEAGEVEDGRVELLRIIGKHVGIVTGGAAVQGGGAERLGGDGVT